MPHYLVHYSIGENNIYVDPASIAGVVWKLAIYHYTEHAMVGETDAPLETDGREVRPLTADEANHLIEEYQASYPKLGDLPDPMGLPPS